MGDPTVRKIELTTFQIDILHELVENRLFKISQTGTATTHEAEIRIELMKIEFKLKEL